MRAVDARSGVGSDGKEAVLAEKSRAIAVGVTWLLLEAADSRIGSARCRIERGWAFEEALRRARRALASVVVDMSVRDFCTCVVGRVSL